MLFSPSNSKEEAALHVVKILTAHNYIALFAGGHVRDMLSGSPASPDADIDIATNAHPSAVGRLFERVIPVGEHFGVLIVVENGYQFEVATFRSENGYQDGRHPDRVVFTNPEEDAQRRDFTINGMFFDPVTNQVLDYVNGKKDLSEGIIRAIGDPGLRFAEDHLRLLRAIRFAARFGFEIDPATWRAISESASSIQRVSAERIFTELDKMLCGPNPERAFRLLHQSGLLKEVLPEVNALYGLAQPPEFHPEGDVLTHTLLALSKLSRPSQVLAWSTLLHDIGKPATRTESDRIRFNNHHRAGSILSTAILKRLRAPNALIEAVFECVDNHMHFMNVKEMRLSTLKRFLSRPTYEDEIELHRADCLASHGQLDNYHFCKDHRAEFAIDQLKPTPLLSGRDLLAHGLKPGPIFRDILTKVYDLQLENQFSTKEEALEELKRIINDPDHALNR